MKKKRTITIYQDLNEPYENMLKRGVVESPEVRYSSFFAMQARLWALKGRPNISDRTITVEKPTWI